MFPWSPKACPPKAGVIQWGGGSTMNFPLMGPFYIFRLSQRGDRAPRPPLNRPLVIRTVEIVEHTYPQDIISEKQLGNLKKAQEDMSDTDKTLIIIDTCFVDLCGTGTELFFFLGVNMVK